MRYLFALVLAVAVSTAAYSAVAPQPAQARAHATPTPAPTPLPPEEPDATKVARQQFVAWQLGTLDRARYTDELNGLADADAVTKTSAALTQLGSLQSMEWLGYRTAPGVIAGTKTYLYRVHGSRGTVLMQFSIQPDGKIAGIIFRDNLTDF
jgi:hypothetical protein